VSAARRVTDSSVRSCFASVQQELKPWPSQVHVDIDVQIE
jgi:hypothetical protein